MCGDLYCRSCGPAQGNDRCPFCGAWSADGGCEQPAICAAYQAAADEAEIADAMAVPIDRYDPKD